MVVLLKTGVVILDVHVVDMTTVDAPTVVLGLALLPAFLHIHPLISQLTVLSLRLLSSRYTSL